MNRLKQSTSKFTINLEPEEVYAITLKRLNNTIDAQRDDIRTLHAQIERMTTRQNFSDAKILELLRAIEMKDKHAKGLRK